MSIPYRLVAINVSRLAFPGPVVARWRGRFLLFCIWSLILLPVHAASDWPQFLGPTRDGVYHGSAIASAWPKEGPPIVWHKEVGEGFSGLVVSGGKLILFHRREAREIVECLAADSGKNQWSFDYPTSYRDDFGFDEGPRGTPSIDSGKVFTFGADGALHCLEFQTGRKIWSVDTKKEFAVDKGFFGPACSPLVESNVVILQVGGKGGAGIVAFNSETGQLLWKATGHEAGYSSPVTGTIGGKRWLFCFTRSGLVALEPANGRVIFEFPWRARMHASVNAATPRVIGDTIFLSASYDTGAILLRFKETGPERLWSGDDILSCHYATGVHREGFLYGIDGRADPGFSPAPSLRCVELKTGKVRWAKEGLGAGLLIQAGKHLLLMNDRGELILADASPDGFKEVSRAQILSREVRAHPALADGLFFARSKNQLVCVDLRQNPKP